MTALISLRDRSLSSLSFSCFWTLLDDSTVLTVTEYFPYLFVLQNSFVRLPYVKLEVSYVDLRKN